MDMDIDVYHRPNLKLACNVGSRLFLYNLRTFVKKAMSLADLPLDLLDAGLNYLKDYPFEDDDTKEFKKYFVDYIESYWIYGCFPSRY